MSDIPEFDLISISPLSVLLSLEIRACLLFIRLRFICDKGVIIVVCGHVGNYLSGLIFDNYSMRRSALLLINREEMVLLLSGWLEVEDLNVLIIGVGISFLIIYFVDYFVSTHLVLGYLEFTVAITDHFLV
jgi:hypothetical protein